MPPPAPPAPPAGTVWHVSIQWMPRWRALARRFGGWRDERGSRRAVSRTADWTPDPTMFFQSGGGGSGGFDLPDLADDFLGGLVAILVLILAVAVFWWVLIPLLLVVLDVTIVIILLIAGIIGRVLLHRPWTLEAT